MVQGRDPGWYPDPQGLPTDERYWDGTTWTADDAAGHAAAATGPAPAAGLVPRSRWFAEGGALLGRGDLDRLLPAAEEQSQHVDRHRDGSPGHHRRGIHRALRHQEFEQQEHPAGNDDDGPAHRPCHQAAAHHGSPHHLRAHNNGDADHDRGADNYHHRGGIDYGLSRLSDCLAGAPIDGY